MRARAGRLAEALAKEFLERHDVVDGLPVEPGALAHAIGAMVLPAELREDGLVQWVGGQPIILVSAAHSPERNRFTIAHELGHVVLRAPNLQTPTVAAARVAFSSEEVLCDAFAGALLMPRWYLARRFAAAPQTLVTIESLARATRVSLSAALVRLREVHRWERTLLQWKLEGGRWVYDAEAGLWPSERGMLMPTEGTGWALSDVWSRGVARANISLPLRVAGIDRDVPAEARFYRDRAVTLIDAPSRLVPARTEGKTRHRPRGSMHRAVGRTRTGSPRDRGVSSGLPHSS